MPVASAPHVLPRRGQQRRRPKSGAGGRNRVEAEPRPRHRPSRAAAAANAKALRNRRRPLKPTPPTSTLQTTPATAEGVVERAIRASLARATADLNRIDYRVLNADARTQYDTAKRFISQADGAMRSKNLVFAKNLADKAAALAAQ